jgi:ribosomal protein S18 acetylase RimI-like enzyme
LIRECEAVFAERGIGLVTCLIEEDNEASLDLFASAGYEIRRDVVYLRKPLAGTDW